jgi:RHS repeat-associated protein
VATTLAIVLGVVVVAPAIPAGATEIGPPVVAQASGQIPPPTCTGSPTGPSPSISTLAFLAEGSANTVQAMDETTGAIIGPAITVGTNPDGIAFWNPVQGDTLDPEVIVANKGSDSVTIIDAVTRTVTATISLPTGSAPSVVAASPNSPYAMVIDTGTGDVSVINLTNNTDAGEIFLYSSTNLLNDVTFASSGSVAFVTDRSVHRIFVVQYTGGSAPYFTNETADTYHDSTVDPTGLATDLTSPSSNTLYVTNALTSTTGSLLQFSYATGTALASPTTVTSFSTSEPWFVKTNPGATLAYVQMNGSNNVDQVTISGGTVNTMQSTSFTHVTQIGLAASGAQLITANSASAKVEGFAAPTSANTTTGLYTTTTNATVTAIATALPLSVSWNSYVITSGSTGNFLVINSASEAVTQSVTDANSPVALAVSPDGQFVYVANTASVTVIATADFGTSTNPVVATITGLQGTQPNVPNLSGIAVSPSGDAVIVTDDANGALDVIDTNAADGSSYRNVVQRIGALGSGNSSSQFLTASPVFSPDGLYAYASEYNGTGGVVVLQKGSTTASGYTFKAVDVGLTENGDQMTQPTTVAIDPSDEHLYVIGGDSTHGDYGALFSFSIATDGTLQSTSSGPGPQWMSITPQGVAFSPESTTLFVTQSGSNTMDSVTTPYGPIVDSYGTAAGYAGDVAVAGDGSVMAVTVTPQCTGQHNEVDLFTPNGVNPYARVLLTNAPFAVAFAPQSSPRALAASEYYGGANNPAESAVSGMHDVVAAGNPGDAPVASGGVDTATLSYSLSLDSMTIPDVGISLDQGATYDSQRASTSGLLGNGWDYTYGMTASQNAHNASQNPCAIIVTQEDGSTVMFSPTAAGPYSTCPTSSYVAAPQAQASLSFASSCNGTDSCYVMTRGGTTSYSIDESTGQLVKIVDLHNNAVTISWGAHGSTCPGASSTQPCHVVGADQAVTGSPRTLTFSYPSPGLGTCPSTASSCVVATDPIGRTLTYVKNSSGQLVAVTLANSSTSATYSFAYNGSSQMTQWCDPVNSASCSSATGTTITWSSGLVTQVEGPNVNVTAGPFTTPSPVLSPITTFARTSFDAATGDGTVQVDNANYNQSSSMQGASITLDSYALGELVSTETGYGPTGDYGSMATSAPLELQPAETATPIRDSFNLLADATMNSLNDVAYPVGSSSQYNLDATYNSYSASGDLLTSTDPSGDTTLNTYNQLHEPLTTTDALGNVTTNTYDSAGDLLTTTSPAENVGGSPVESSSAYNSNGTLCASRDAIETSVSGAVTLCTTTHATSHGYDVSGDLTTTTDPLGDVSQSVFTGDGATCATETPDGYHANGALSSCSSSGVAYATEDASLNLYNDPATVVASLDTAGTSFATSNSCFNANGDATSVSAPMSNFSSCGSVSPTTTSHTSFTYFDPSGNGYEQIAPEPAAGVQGATSWTIFDAQGQSATALSPQGYAAWVANNSVSLTPYETVSEANSSGQSVASEPAADNGTGCGPSTTPCPETTTTTFNGDGEATQSSSPTGAGGTGTPGQTTTAYNPDGTAAQVQAPINGGTQTTTNSYDQNQNETGSTVSDGTHSTSTSTAFNAAGQPCWSAVVTTLVSTPSCSTVPSGSTIASVSASYYDADGRLIAQVGPGGAASVKPGATCSPLTAFGTYLGTLINTSELCAFTTYYVYNEGGQLVEKILPSLSSSTSGYVTAGPTTTYTYDYSGNKSTLVNPAGATTTNIYDAANRLVAVGYSDISAKTCDPVSGSNTMNVCDSYNADGTKSQMIDSSGTTSYSYDLLGRLTSVTDGNSKTVTYGYNAAGQRSCVSYPGFANTCATSGAGTTSPPAGDVSNLYDSEGRLSSVVDWKGDAFTNAYDCVGNLLWTLETPPSAIPSITPCQGSGGSAPAAPSTAPSGSTYVLTAYAYSTGASGNQLTAKTTAALTTGAPIQLLAFGSTGSPLTYDENGNLTVSTPIVRGMAQTADQFTYDGQQRVASGPEAGVASRSYNYVNSAGSGFASPATVDGMGINAVAGNGTFDSAYRGNGELCWVVSGTGATSNTCASPTGTTAWEGFTYDASGDRTGTSANHGYGATSTLTWNQDTGTMGCINTSGTTCTTPSASAPQTATYAYNAERLRMSATTWNSSTSSTQTTLYTWDSTSSALMSDGSADYVYGLNPNVPVAQVDIGDAVTSELLTDTNSNVRGVVEVTASAASPFALANYTDYDSYGAPTSGAGGTSNLGGLTVPAGTDADSATRYGFGGGYEDATGLIYLVNRYYDSGTGQFVSVDPAVVSTATPFAYVADNPADLTDPLGQSVDLAGTATWATTNAPIQHGDNNGFTEDCTDFASRALFEGGGDPMTYSSDFYWDLLHKGDRRLWFQVTDLLGITATSATWGQAQALAQHFRLNGSTELVSHLDLGTKHCTQNCLTALPSSITPGDIIFANWDGSKFGGISHAGVIIKNGAAWEIAQHTPNRIDNFVMWRDNIPKKNYKGGDTNVWIFSPSPG